MQRKPGRKTKALLALLILPVLVGEGSQPRQKWPRPEPEVLSAATHRELKAFFRAVGYDWNTVNSGVPPFILATLPPDLGRISQSDERKRLFFLSLLPMVLLANDEIGRQREELLALFAAHDRGELLADGQRRRVAALAAEYGVDADPLNDQPARRRLLLRLDIVPAPLALAQAANESGYGTSRFARAGNNLFGEWTFLPGSGMVPAERPAGETYEVRRFPTLYDSVKSYMKNLNTNRAYSSFRLQRERLRSEGEPLLGEELAQGLKNYSTRGAAYVSEIQAIIRRNRLSLLSDASLRPEITAIPPSGDEGRAVVSRQLRFPGRGAPTLLD